MDIEDVFRCVQIGILIELDVIIPKKMIRRLGADYSAPLTYAN